jgi:hypothetical protein
VAAEPAPGAAAGRSGYARLVGGRHGAVPDGVVAEERAVA